MTARCAGTGKVRHPSRDHAMSVIRKLHNKGLNAYQCRSCNGWHLGNSRQPLKVQARIDQLLGKTR